ncbi:MAG TPA: hypothetical protein VH414_12625 [Lichenihabitans sp.]|jgi:hypothetical protein|nr:hypothetical protein [Lichenihabitans sp.]
MFKFNTAVAALALAGLAGTTIAASADPLQNEMPQYRRHHPAYHYRPLTVVRRRAPVVVAAPAAPVVAAPGVVTGAASTLVGLPFQVLGGIFPAPGPRKGGVTEVRYENAGAETAKIDEGFAQPVPVDKSGPIYVVENGDPTISPLTFIGAPIRAAGTIAQTPFTILGATGL